VGRFIESRSAHDSPPERDANVTQMPRKRHGRANLPRA